MALQSYFGPVEASGVQPAAAAPSNVSGVGAGGNTPAQSTQPSGSFVGAPSALNQGGGPAGQGGGSPFSLSGVSTPPQRPMMPPMGEGNADQRFPPTPVMQSNRGFFGR